MSGLVHREFGKLVALLVTISLIVLLATCAWVLVGKAGNLNELPSLQNLVGYGCEVNGPIAEIVEARPYRRNVWVVNFWAEHAVEGKRVKDWKLDDYAWRKSSERGMKDCNKFFKRMRRARRQEARR